MEDKRRTASDTSSAQTPGNGIGKHIVERNLSSSSALDTPRSTIGGTFHVCLEGKYLGILMSGMLDKRREGAVRAGYARRLFLLSVRGCHYYRKADESEIFGTERGHLSLRDFAYAKIIPEAEAPYGTVEAGNDKHFVGLFSKQHTLTWFLRVDTLVMAKAWVAAISAAQDVAKKHLYPNEWTPEMYEEYSAHLTGASTTTTAENQPDSARSSAPTDNLVTPSILAISVSSAKDNGQGGSRERLVSRKVELQKEISLGAIRLADINVHFILSDQQVLTLPPSTLKAASGSASSQPFVTTLTLPNKSNATCIYVHVSLRVSLPNARQAAAATTLPLHRAKALMLPTPVNAFALSFSVLYVVSCILAYAFGPPFQGVMQVTVVMGFFLSVSVVASAILHIHDAAASSAASTSNSQDDVSPLHHVTMQIVQIEASSATPTAATAEAEAAPAETTATPPSAAPAASNRAQNPIQEIAFSPRFIAAEKGDEVKGRARFEKTLQWRRENRVDGLLYEPQPHFHLIKRNYPQYFHGKSIKGQCVYYEKVGKIDLKAMKAAGLTMDELMRHYIFLTEYMWTLLEPSDSGRSVTVLDVEGIGFYDFTGDVMDFVRQAMGFVGAHYPERSAQIFIVNVPSWFNMLWKVISPMIDPVTKEKIRICKGKAVKDELLKSIAEDQLPSDYGGGSVALGHSKEEIALAKHVDDILAQQTPP
ncbi:hypothetical protein LEN26_005914 [Aphanomyces euteiches]|nr:hypothetical protein AeMF1_021644 [Aphanomyces euteiches]KAH9137092.1 hypothetical protein LEN26_005914 [Aphanomyces euteiches]